VQVVHGAAGSDGVLTGTATVTSAVVESFGGGRFRFDADLTVGQAGGFGYSVRIVPSHPMLASVAELGLAAVPVQALSSAAH
jgi:glycogen phosphorylase